MKLPLKRFHQGEFNETVVQNPLAEGGEYCMSDAFDFIDTTVFHWNSFLDACDLFIHWQRTCMVTQTMTFRHSRRRLMIGPIVAIDL
jgi:hypothetical protein